MKKRILFSMLYSFCLLLVFSTTTKLSCSHVAPSTTSFHWDYTNTGNTQSHSAVRDTAYGNPQNEMDAWDYQVGTSGTRIQIDLSGSNLAVGDYALGSGPNALYMFTVNASGVITGTYNFTSGNIHIGFSDGNHVSGSFTGVINSTNSITGDFTSIEVQ